MNPLEEVNQEEDATGYKMDKTCKEASQSLPEGEWRQMSIDTNYKIMCAIDCDYSERKREGDCSNPGPLTVVPDAQVPEDPNDPDRADQFAIRISSILGSGKGVWTRVVVPKGSIFGPYRGIKTKTPSSHGYCWQIQHGQHGSHYVDARNGSVTNWMRYVNSARHEGEQNMTAFVHQGEIYYRTKGAIPPHIEVLVWFEEFAHDQGINTDAHHKSQPEPLRMVPQEDGKF